MPLTLVIGNKNYSSWSMRPWVAMRGLGIPFQEHPLSFTLGMGAGFQAAVRRFSPAGRVPVLVDGDTVVWDSLAILEYLHERFPNIGVWPAALADRTQARCLAAEMHAGFGALRNHCPMNIEAQFPEIGQRLLQEHAALRADLARVDQIFSAARGPFLFGDFSAVDAFYAPVALRVRGFALPLSAPAAAYAQRLLAAPGPAAWISDALQEQEFVPEDEPYRTQR